MAPLVSPEVDLRDFAFMPLDVVRLRDSDLAAIATGDGFRAAVLLWCAAWHQVPAASLPNDDRALAHLAGYGRDLNGWKKVRADAMRGFVECDDGRFYHPTIAEKANESWEKKMKFRERTAAAREAKRLASLSQSERDAELALVTKTVTNPVTEIVTGHKGEGQCKGQGTGDRDISSSSFHSEEASQLAASDLKSKCEKAAAAKFPKGFSRIAKLAESGVSVEGRILPIIRDVADHARANGETIRSWGYFAEAICDLDREAVPLPVAAVTPIWLAADTKEFVEANRVLRALGLPPKVAMSVGSKPTRGAYFPPQSEILRMAEGAST